MIDLTRRPQNVYSRSISAENPTGGKGMGAMIPVEEGTAGANARELGLGWKTNPYLILQPGETALLGNIEGSGVITHLWMTPACAGAESWRNMILRIYWEGQETPSVEAPVADFFCVGWQEAHQISSLAVCVNPGSGLNCYWEMPFRRAARFTLENRNPDAARVYYQIDYRLCDVPEDSLYFHAQFRRTAPVPYGEVYTVLDGVKGVGSFVGMYMLWETDNTRNNHFWIGEGEFKFYLDGDKEFPTYCGTGLEDYFCGSYNFEDQKLREYRAFTTPYTGMQIAHTDGALRRSTMFGMYRWHINDPIYFYQDLRVTVHALGWKLENSDFTYLPLQDKIETVAYWYQTLPAAPFPPLPDKDNIRLRP